MATLPSWWDRVDKIMSSAGVPTRVWTSIAFAESGFVPTKVNSADPKGGSYGLFQLNLGGQGSAYRGNPNYLLDPINNAMISAPHIAAAVKKCPPDNMTCIVLNSGHPVEDGRMPNDPSTPGFVAYMNRLYRYTTGQDGQRIYDLFTGGVGVPGDPDNPGSGGGGGGLIGDIGSQIGGGIKDAIGSGFNAIFSAWADERIQTQGPIYMAFAGVILVAFGTVLAAAKSPVGQVAASVAPPQVSMGIRAARSL